MKDRLNWVALEEVKKAFQKDAFVPMPGGQQPPQAGGMPPGMDPSGGAGGMPPGMPPGAGGMPPGGDPSMGGMPPGGDPTGGAGMPPGAMPPGADPTGGAGGMPPGGDPSGGAPVDPSMMGPPPGQVTMSVQELIQLIQVLKGGGDKGAGDGTTKKSAKPDVGALLQGLHDKVDALSGAPAPAAPQ